MPAVADNVPLTEAQKVEEWRHQELVRAGYPPEAAAELAGRVDVDLHRAVNLLQQGCAVATALRILR